jgi:tripartite-type tricarboxylate transporter receptor subunit TctC
VLPQVPTFIEAGLRDYDEKSWQALFAPGATPKPVINKLSTEIGRILAAPDFKTKVETMGFETFISTSDQFAAMIKAETAMLAKVIKVANIRVEN